MVFDLERKREDPFSIEKTLLFWYTLRNFLQKMNSRHSQNQMMDMGNPVLSWRAFDHQPYHRGWLWYVLFCIVLFGGAVWAVLDDPQWGWLMALTFFVAAAVYFWSHRKGNELHNTTIFEKGILIGEKKFIPKGKIAGYWFIYEPGVEILNIELKGRNKRQISLQMGNLEPDFFREHLGTSGIEELEDRHEKNIDKWIRIFKL